MSQWKHMPDHARAALKYLSEKVTAKPEGQVDIEWAHKIMARKAAGESIAQATLDMARAAIAKHGGNP